MKVQLEANKRRIKIDTFAYGMIRCAKANLKIHGRTNRRVHSVPNGLFINSDIDERVRQKQKLRLLKCLQVFHLQVQRNLFLLPVFRLSFLDNHQYQHFNSCRFLSCIRECYVIFIIKFNQCNIICISLNSKYIWNVKFTNCCILCNVIHISGSLTDVTVIAAKRTTCANIGNRVFSQILTNWTSGNISTNWHGNL